MNVQNSDTYNSSKSSYSLFEFPLKYGYVGAKREFLDIGFIITMKAILLFTVSIETG